MTRSLLRVPLLGLLIVLLIVLLVLVAQRQEAGAVIGWMQRHALPDHGLGGGGAFAAMRRPLSPQRVATPAGASPTDTVITAQFNATRRAGHWASLASLRNQVLTSDAGGYPVVWHPPHAIQAFPVLGEGCRSARLAPAPAQRPC